MYGRIFNPIRLGLEVEINDLVLLRLRNGCALLAWVVGTFPTVPVILCARHSGLEDAHGVFGLVQRVHNVAEQTMVLRLVVCGLDRVHGCLPIRLEGTRFGCCLRADDQFYELVVLHAARRSVRAVRRAARSYGKNASKGNNLENIVHVYVLRCGCSS